MSGTKKLIAQSKNRINVFYDPINSHAATHLEDTPQLMDLMTEAIENMILEDENIATHVDMGRVVGTCDVVKIDESDEVVYGIRKNRDEGGHVPFTKNRKGDPCSSVAVHLIKQSDKSYILSSAWIGIFGEEDEPFPNSPEANERSIDFWNSHAFVWGSQEIQPGTLIKDYPW